VENTADRFRSGETVELEAGCKVNLFLKIQGKRPDGYHEISTLFYPLGNPRDRLRISPNEQPGLQLECLNLDIDADANLVSRAYDAFASATGFRPGLKADLVKNIPVGAGLGGGSSDAAAMLGFLNCLAPNRLTLDDLIGLAGKLGADVPFFLLNRPAWGEGAGEKLQLVRVDLSGMTLVLVCPDVHVSTAWAYGEWDRRVESGFRAPGSLTFGNDKDNWLGSGFLELFNSFEPVVLPTYPAIRRIKERLLSLGAAGAVMSGSGAGVLGLYRTQEAAEAAYDALSGQEIPCYLNRL